MRHRLLPHPDTPPSAVRAVEVEVDLAGRKCLLAFAVTGADALVIPEAAAGERADGLWQTTCFELFLRPAGGQAYFEFNLAPSTQWAAYAFDGYRAGMRDVSVALPRIVRTDAGLNATLDLSGLPSAPWRIGLSAVIEERDSTKSYWALAHPPGKPDFHHQDCFAIELPPAA